MYGKLKQLIDDFFTLSKSEQRGIYVLTVLIIIITGMAYFIRYSDNRKVVDNSEYLDRIEMFRKYQQKARDSIRIINLQNKGKLDYETARQILTPFSFNPNDLSEGEWLAMGLSAKQAGTIVNYVSKGGRFKTKKDLKKIYCLSEGEYQVLEPYILLPSSTGGKQKNTGSVKSERRKKPSVKKESCLLTEINSTDSATLVKNLHFKPWIAGRIIKYRTLLGGYYRKDQLFEVYGIDSAKLLQRLNYINADTGNIVKINLNKCSFKELLHHPYISYETTKKVINYREKHGGFKSVNDLLNKGIIDEETYRKVWPYLIVE